jgi:hypothetical protein
LKDYGFEALDADATMFRLTDNKGTMLLSLYVDDGLVAHNNDEMYAEFIKALSDKFELSSADSEVKWYLGISIFRDYEKGCISLSQKQYIKDMLKRFKMEDTKPSPTPLEVGQRLTSEDCPHPDSTDKDTVRAYQQMLGSLMYTVAWTAPECAHAVSQCARYMSNPGPSHIKAAKRILSYLKGRMDIPLTYHRDNACPNVLYASADADHAGDPEGRRSVTGYVVMLNGAAVSWQSNRQAVTALSSAEAEYYAASAVGCDLAYLRRLMASMGYPQDKPTQVAEDNVACIYMSKSSAMHHKSKHIDVRVYKLRELVNDGTMELYQVASADQTADALTKSVSAELLRRHRQRMLGHPEPSSPDPSTKSGYMAFLSPSIICDDSGDAYDGMVRDEQPPCMTWSQIIMLLVIVMVYTHRWYRGLPEGCTGQE